MQNSILSLFLSLNLENSFKFRTFFQYFEIPWPFRQIRRIVNKNLCGGRAPNLAECARRSSQARPLGGRRYGTGDGKKRASILRSLQASSTDQIGRASTLVLSKNFFVLNIILLTFLIYIGRKWSRNCQRCPKVPLFDFDHYLAEVSR